MHPLMTCSCKLFLQGVLALHSKTPVFVSQLLLFKCALALAAKRPLCTFLFSVTVEFRTHLATGFATFTRKKGSQFLENFDVFDNLALVLGQKLGSPVQEGISNSVRILRQA